MDRLSGALWPLLLVAGPPVPESGRRTRHLAGAEDIAALMTVVTEARRTRWTCAGTACRATPSQTLSYCVECARVLCRHCGGPITERAPVPAFVCVHCAVAADYTEPLLPAPSGLSPVTAALARRAVLKPLVRGRMHLLSIGQRRATRVQYAGGREAYFEFCRILDIAPFPASPAMLMDFAVWCILDRGLDSSTTANKLRGVFAFYDYVRVRLCFRHVRNPSRDTELIEMMRTLGVNFKKPGGGKMALSAVELFGLFRLGFVTRTRRGRWARLFALCLNFAMLRSTAVSAVKVCYRVQADSSIIFLEESEVSIYHHAGFGAEIIDFRITSDKNVDARRAADGAGRHSVVPGELPALGVFFARELREYLLTMRPSSGGPLLAYPDKKGAGFSSKPGTGFNKCLRESYRRAFPDVTDAYLSRIGSHSGRKTLSQLLWEHGFSRQLIAEAGGWYIKREAVDLYFRTSAVLILRALASLRVSESSACAGPFTVPPHQQSDH